MRVNITREGTLPLCPAINPVLDFDNIMHGLDGLGSAHAESLVHMTLLSP